LSEDKGGKVEMKEEGPKERVFPKIGRKRGPGEKYFCTLCNRFHRIESKKGQEHKSFAYTKSANLPSQNPQQPIADNDYIRNIVREEIQKALEGLNPRGEREKIIEREIELDDDLTLPRKVKLNPEVIQYYRWILATSGKNISLDEFINEVIHEHMSECLGVESAIIRRNPRRKLMGGGR